MGLHPKVLGGLQGIDPEVFPPGLLIARLMQLSMVTTAERHGEFIADFKAHRSRLGKAQMMRVTWLASADQTRLGGHELQMRLVAQPFGFAEGEFTLVDRAWEGFGSGWRQWWSRQRLSARLCPGWCRSLRPSAPVDDGHSSGTAAGSASCHRGGCPAAAVCLSLRAPAVVRAGFATARSCHCDKAQARTVCRR